MAKYLITGASGYIGSMLAKRLILLEEELAVIVRDPARLDADIRAKAEIVTADVSDREAIFRLTKTVDYILHCAAPTNSAYMVSHPSEVIKTIVNGTQNILELAKNRKTKCVVYLSSMEVYGQIDCADGRRITENELGYIDVANVRSSYPLAKLTAENLCHAYYKEFGVPVKIARLAQTFGRGILPSDHRVFAQFARSVRDGTDIVLHTLGDSMGNYCSIDDALDGILYILAHGENGQAYNVVNEANTMTIRQMAELVAGKIACGKIKVKYMPVENEQSSYAAKTGLRLSGEKLRRLGWEATAGLEKMYWDMLGEKNVNG